MKVKCDNILEALEFTNDETEFFFNKRDWRNCHVF